ETLNDGDQLLVRRAPWVAKRVDRMFVREPAQAQQLAGALAPVQVQLGRPRREQEPAHFGGAEELDEFRHSHIDQEQYENPERDGDEAMPGEAGAQIGDELARPMAVDDGEM